MPKNKRTGVPLLIYFPEKTYARLLRAAKRWGGKPTPMALRIIEGKEKALGKKRAEVLH